MRVAILGATSQIVRDLIVSFFAAEGKYLHLFARRPDEVKKWLGSAGFAKLHAECRHRSHSELPIIDIRVFNYFSRTQDIISARFLITDILRAISGNTLLKTSPDYIVRDYLHPSDFYKLTTALLPATAANAVVDKPNLLAAMQREFGLRYEVTETTTSVNAAGSKPHYYSLNRRAADFGYQPGLTSIDGILREAGALLGEV